MTVDSRDMAWLAANGSGRLAARTLADWIIQGRSDFRLVDLRTPDAFAAGPQIPSAENMALTSLFDGDLNRGEKILLVGDDEVTVAQAWLLLQASGYTGASIVAGGLAAWRDQVVYPRVDGLDATTRARLEAVSAHFGGVPRIGGGADTPALAARVRRRAGGAWRAEAPAGRREEAGACQEAGRVLNSSLGRSHAHWRSRR